MRKPLIPHDAFVFVGDGRKALILRNAGDEKFANFVVERTYLDDNPATRDQGADRPGRAFAAAGSSRRSAVEPTDWHDIEEHRFADRVAKTLARLVRERKAPARSDHQRLTNMPVCELEKQALAAPEAA